MDEVGTSNIKIEYEQKENIRKNDDNCEGEGRYCEEE